jgi:hypothetical protein
LGVKTAWGNEDDIKVNSDDLIKSRNIIQARSAANVSTVIPCCFYYQNRGPWGLGSESRKFEDDQNARSSSNAPEKCFLWRNSSISNYWAYTCSYLSILTNMSWPFSSWVQPASPEADAVAAEATAAAAAAGLDPEEVRRRRLATLEATAAPTTGSTASRVDSSPPPSVVTSSRAPAVAPTVETQPTSPLPTQAQAPLRSPEKASAKTLTLMLESVLQLSLRSSCQPPVIYLRDAAATSPDGNFDSSRVSDLLCMHLADIGGRAGGGSSSSACYYLYGCFKRVQQRFFSCSEAQRAELTR